MQLLAPELIVATWQLGDDPLARLNARNSSLPSLVLRRSLPLRCLIDDQVSGPPHAEP